MDKPSFLYRAWTYHPVVNCFIVLILDISNRLIWLSHMSGQVKPHAWVRPVTKRMKDRFDFKPMAADIIRRHELAKFCTICDDDDP